LRKQGRRYKKYFQVKMQSFPAALKKILYHFNPSAGEAKLHERLISLKNGGGTNERVAG
jgi:hypothetical protein